MVDRSKVVSSCRVFERLGVRPVDAARRRLDGEPGPRLPHCIGESLLQAQGRHRRRAPLRGGPPTIGIPSGPGLLALPPQASPARLRRRRGNPFPRTSSTGIGVDSTQTPRPPAIGPAALPAISAQPSRPARPIPQIETRAPAPTLCASKPGPGGRGRAGSPRGHLPHTITTPSAPGRRPRATGPRARPGSTDMKSHAASTTCVEPSRAPASGRRGRPAGARDPNRLRPGILPGMGQPGRLGGDLREEPRPALPARPVLLEPPALARFADPYDRDRPPRRRTTSPPSRSRRSRSGPTIA